jgi:hypothetical protein
MDAWSPAALLPGAFVVLLGAALAGVLRRWYDPVPGRVFAVHGLVIALLAGPALVGGQVLLPLNTLRGVPALRMFPPAPQEDHPLHGDLTLIVVPAEAGVRRALGNGELPLWEPRVGGGMPQLADPLARVMDPLARITLPFPLAEAHGIQAAVRLLVAMAFTFLLLRRQGISDGPAVAGSLAYGLGGSMIQWLGWPQGTAVAYLPALVYAVVRADRPGGRRDVLLLAAVAFCLLTCGHPEMIAIIALGGGLFAMARLVPALRRRDAGPLRRFAGAGLLAAALAAPMLVPAALYLPQTERTLLVELLNEARREGGPLAGWHTAERRRDSLERSEARLTALVAPRAFGDRRFARLYWGDTNSLQDASGWATTAALLAALAALFPGRGVRRFPEERLSLGLLGVMAVVVARPPLVEALLLRVPVVSTSATLFHRGVALILFATVYLAACTWERWRRGELARGRVLVAAGCLGALLLWAHLGHPPPAGAAARAGEILAVRSATLTLHLGALVAAAALLLSRRPSRAAQWSLAAVLLVEGLAVQGPMNPSVTRSLYYPTPPSVAFLQEHLGDDRLAALGAVFPPNLGQMYDLAQLGGYAPMKPAALWWIHRSLQLHRRQEGGWRLGHPLLDFLGVRYAMSEPQVRPPGLERVFRRYSGWIWRRPRALPRLFLASAARRLEVDPEAPPSAFGSHLMRIEDAERVLLSSEPGAAPGATPAAWKPRRPEASTLTIAGHGASWWAAEADLAERRLLATSLYQDGGWRVEVDGERVPAVTVNGFFAGAWLPPGRHRVEVVYRPPGLVAGALLAALGLAGGITWWGWAGRRGRRRGDDLRPGYPGGEPASISSTT